MTTNDRLHRLWLWLRWGSYNRYHRFRFDSVAKGVLKSPPISGKDDGCVIVSLVSHRDLWMYLVSAKSFRIFFQHGRFVVLNDGSLTAKDVSILKGQIAGLEVRSAADVSNKHCPKGGCWERLLCVADYMTDHYVIVLDADMITQFEVSEVEECFRENRSFIMGIRENQTVQSMPEIWKEEMAGYGKVPLSSSRGTQETFDTNMDRIPGWEKLKYLRGSGGFNGFAKGSFSRFDVEKFSREMEKIFGARWHDWGTEQVTLCFLIANSPDACILPYPKYALHYAGKKVNYEGSSVLHFIGMSRFNTGFYKNQARTIIQRMKV